MGQEAWTLDGSSSTEEVGVGVGVVDLVLHGTSEVVDEEADVDVAGEGAGEEADGGAGEGVGVDAVGEADGDAVEDAALGAASDVALDVPLHAVEDKGFGEDAYAGVDEDAEEAGVGVEEEGVDVVIGVDEEEDGASQDAGVQLVVGGHVAQKKAS